MGVKQYIKHLLFLSLLTFTASGKATENLSIDDFLKRVNEKNLSLKAAFADVDAAKAREAGFEIPPPSLGLIQVNIQGANSGGFEFNQNIPFPTKLKNNQKAKKFETLSKQAMLEGSKTEVLAKARLLYVSLWLNSERIKFLNERKNAIQQHLKLSNASARSDSFLKIHVLKAESDLDLLDNEILEQQQSLREKQIQLSEISNGDPTKFEFNLIAPQLSEIPILRSVDEANQIRAKFFTVESLKASESEAQSSWLPDLSFRFKEMNATAMSPRSSELMLGISLPFVFFWEPIAQTKSASAARLKSEIELDQEKLRVSSRKNSLLSKAQSLKKQLELIQDKLLPRAEKRMRLVHNIAPRDVESLQDHREAMEAFPDLKLKALVLREQFEEVLAELTSYSSKGSP